MRDILFRGKPTASVMKRLWYKFVLLLCKPYGWFLNGTGRVIDRMMSWCKKHGA